MAMDQQTALERQQTLYREKNAHLRQYLEPVEPYEFTGRYSRRDLLSAEVTLRMLRETVSLW